MLANNNKQLCALTYNSVHNYILSIALILIGVMFNPTLLHLGLILETHVSAARLMGFGLKSPEGFKPTHVQKV